MSSQSKRIEGVANQLGGRVKSTVGGLLGNDRLKAEGTATELLGQLQVEAAKAAERFLGKAEEVIGFLKKRIGAFLDDRGLQARGAAEEAQGQARQAVS
jgi:uncharacterized protein YjbJ (UPF0337 family)